MQSGLESWQFQGILIIFHIQFKIENAPKWRSLGGEGEERGEVAKMQCVLCCKSALPASKHKNKKKQVLSGGAVARNPWQLSE